MAWRYCKNCFGSRAELGSDYEREDRAQHVYCSACRQYMKMYRLVNEFAPEKTNFVYGFVELDNEFDQNEIELFYVGRGTKIRLLTKTDRNDRVMAHRRHLEQWRSFRLKTLAECDTLVESINYEYALIEAYRPRFNEDFSKRVK